MGFEDVPADELVAREHGGHGEGAPKGSADVACGFFGGGYLVGDYCNLLAGFGD